MVRRSLLITKDVASNQACFEEKKFNLGMDSDADIGTLPISE
jgi:hypothetical protein